MAQDTADKLVREHGLVEVLMDYSVGEFVVHLLYVKHRHQSLLMRAFIEFMDKKIEK